jgi:hypothetical protein
MVRVFGELTPKGPVEQENMFVVLGLWNCWLSMLKTLLVTVPWDNTPLCLRVHRQPLRGVLIIHIIDVGFKVICEKVWAHDKAVVRGEDAEGLALGVLDDQLGPWLSVDLFLRFEGATYIVETVDCRAGNVVDAAIGCSQCY